MQRRRLGPNIVRGGNRGLGHGEMGALRSAYRSKRAVPGTVEIESEHETAASAAEPGTSEGRAFRQRERTPPLPARKTLLRSSSSIRLGREVGISFGNGIAVARVTY